MRMSVECDSRAVGTNGWRLGGTVEERLEAARRESETLEAKEAAQARGAARDGGSLGSKPEPEE